MKPTDREWKIQSRKNFWKYWFNRAPDLVILSGIAVIATCGILYKVNDFQENAPFGYRYRYTVWRDDDPRAIRMMSRMDNFKPLRRID